MVEKLKEKKKISTSVSEKRGTKVFKTSSTIITKCDCKSEFQDKIYGKGMRIKNSHFGHTDKDGIWHNVVIKVPQICWNCKNLDDGEYGEYGDCLCPPSCNLNTWMPTRTNQCAEKR